MDRRTWLMAWQLARLSAYYPSFGAARFVARAWAEATGLPWHCAQSAADRAVHCLEARRVAAAVEAVPAYWRVRKSCPCAAASAAGAAPALGLSLYSVSDTSVTP